MALFTCFFVSNEQKLTVFIFHFRLKTCHGREVARVIDADPETNAAAPGIINAETEAIAVTGITKRTDRKHRDTTDVTETNLMSAIAHLATETNPLKNTGNVMTIVVTGHQVALATKDEAPK